jgi:hypothetical protein
MVDYVTSRRTVIVPIGATLNLQAANAVGSIVRLFGPAGEPYSPVDYTGTDASYGPYDDIASFRIETYNGPIPYTITPPSNLVTPKYTKVLYPGERGASGVLVAPYSSLKVTGAGATGRIVPINALGNMAGIPTLFNGSDVVINNTTGAPLVFRVFCSTGTMMVTTGFIAGITNVNVLSVIPGNGVWSDAFVWNDIYPWKDAA